MRNSVRTQGLEAVVGGGLIGGHVLLARLLGWLRRHGVLKGPVVLLGSHFLHDGLLHCRRQHRSRLLQRCNTELAISHLYLLMY